MKKNRIYLDNNATTLVAKEVIAALVEELHRAPANPSSVHFFGREAKARLLKAREQIAQFLQVAPSEVLFTSGGSEAINLLLRGLFPPGRTGHILTSDVEHSCVFHTLKALEKQGCPVDFLPAGLWGAITPEQVEQALTNKTQAIVLSAANNETGVKHDLSAIAEIALRARIPLIIDAVALCGKEPLSIPKGVSALALSGHKFHAPQGTGVAFVRTGLQIEPQILGGDQEARLRAGTQNLPGIIALAKAVELLHSALPEASTRMLSLRQRLESSLIQRLDPVLINGAGPRTVNTSNLSFLRTSGEELLIALDRAGIAVSHGSACSSGALEPSRVLTQMGLPAQVARSAIRFSLSRYTTETEIDTCIQAVSDAVTHLRQ